MTKDLPIVFLPGIGVTCEELEPQKKFLESKGFRVVCLDWPAFNRNTFNFSNHADWVVRELKELNITKAGFFGQSRGGLGLIKLAAIYPDYVAYAIVNSAPAGYGPRSVFPFFLNFVKVVSLLPKPIFSAILKIVSFFSNDPNLNIFMSNDISQLFGCYLDHMLYDWRSDVDKMSCPCVFRYGKKDPWVRLAGNSAVTKSKHNIVYSENTGHSAPNPEELYSLVQRFAK